MDNCKLCEFVMYQLKQIFFYSLCNMLLRGKVGKVNLANCRRTSQMRILDCQIRIWARRLCFYIWIGIRDHLLGLHQINYSHRTSIFMLLWYAVIIHWYDTLLQYNVTIQCCYKLLLYIVRTHCYDNNNNNNLTFIMRVKANSKAHVIAPRQNAWPASWGMLQRHFLLLGKGQS